MENWVTIASIFLSFFAFFISLLTFWMTLLRRGTIKMTQPTQIFLGQDGGATKAPKIYLLTLLYSTAKQGWVIEDLFARLKYGESVHNFNIWVYDDRVAQKLVRGSGLFISETGISTSHHFLLHNTHGNFEFRAGEYKLEIYAKLVGHKERVILNKTALNISESEAKKLKNDNGRGIYFDWGPDSNKYITHIDNKISQQQNKELDIFLQNVFDSYGNDLSSKKV
jgi:hypothetical protein